MKLFFLKPLTEPDKFVVQAFIMFFYQLTITIVNFCDFDLERFPSYWNKKASELINY